MRGEPQEKLEWVESPGAEEGRYLRALLQEFARPRLSGSAGALLTDRALRGQLQALGYEIHELPFSFSAWPARALVPLVGATYLAAMLSTATLLRRNRRGVAAAILLALPPLLGAVAGGASALVAPLPWGRIRTANWLVHTPGCQPRYLVMAHRDSKSQPVSSAARVSSATAAVLAWGALLGLTALRPHGALRYRKFVERSVAVLGLLAGCTLLRCGVGNESPGALDNASGLAALLGVARRERESGDVAFLLTDGEELWLAGAREAARCLPRHEWIINLDGLDDDGSFHLIEWRRWPRRSHAEPISAALAATAAGLGYPLVRRGHLPGILVDHLPLARAGHLAVTLMHGSRRSLRRVHRPCDKADRLSGVGILRAVTLVSQTLQRVRREVPPAG